EIRATGRRNAKFRNYAANGSTYFGKGGNWPAFHLPPSVSGGGDVRACLLNGPGQATQHELRHRQIDKAFSNRRPLLVVLAQTTKAVEPAEGAFHNPAHGLDDKAPGGVLDDLSANTKEGLTPMQESITGIAAVKDQ